MSKFKIKLQIAQLNWPRTRRRSRAMKRRRLTKQGTSCLALLQIWRVGTVGPRRRINYKILKRIQNGLKNHNRKRKWIVAKLNIKTKRTSQPNVTSLTQIKFKLHLKKTRPLSNRKILKCRTHLRQPDRKPCLTNRARAHPVLTNK